MPSNTLLNPDIITRRALVEFKNEMVLLAKVDRQLDPLFEGSIGDMVRVRKRVRYLATSGEDVTGLVQDTHEGHVNVQLSEREVVAMRFSTQELSLDIEEFSERYIRPAVIELVQAVENCIANLYYKVWQFTGTPGTQPSNFLDIGTVSTIMTEQGVPMGSDKRCVFYSPAASLALANGLQNVFPSKIATNAIEYAMIHNYAGLTVYTSQTIMNHINGNFGGASVPLIDGAAQHTAEYDTVRVDYQQNLTIDGWDATATLNRGDVFTIAGVNSVNPRTRMDTARIQTFTVLADAVPVAGSIDVLVSPPLLIDGPHQNITVSPADDAVVTMISGAANMPFAQNLAFHKDAFTVAFGKLVKPIGNVLYGRESMDGVSLRLVGDYDVLTDINIWRLDVLFGCEAQNPGMAVRHTS